MEKIYYHLLYYTIYLEQRNMAPEIWSYSLGEQSNILLQVCLYYLCNVLMFSLYALTSALHKFKFTFFKSHKWS